MNTFKVKNEPLICVNCGEFLEWLNKCQLRKEHPGSGTGTGGYWFQVNDRHMLECVGAGTVTADPERCCYLEACSALGTWHI